MVGPFVQGMLLMGIIYWYSKGMLNLINDYYRVEFQKQLRANETNKEALEPDEIETLLKSEDVDITDKKTLTMWSSTGWLNDNTCPITHKPDVCVDEIQLHKFFEIILPVCFVNYSGFDNKEGNTDECEKNIYHPTNDT